MAKLSKAEEAFLNRMVPHVISGKSFEDAARAVLKDDERLWLAATLNTDLGKEIRSEITTQVYHKLRDAA